MHLVKYDAARKALQIASTIDEVKQIRDQSEAMRAYAKQARDVEFVNWATEIKIRAERRLGEMLILLKRNGGMNAGARMGKGDNQHSLRRSHDATASNLSDSGISKSMSSRCQSVAKIPEQEFENIISDCKDNQRELTSASLRAVIGSSNRNEKAHVSNNSGENEWYTPERIVEASRQVMGSIDCDPATCGLANETVKAELIFTIDNSGLENQWYGNVWMNPPYIQPLISQFCDAVVVKYLDKEINQACILVNNATETKWGYSLLNNCVSVCFVTSRIKFIGVDGVKGSPLQGQMIVFLGDNKALFKEIFSSLGVVLCQ